MYEEFKKLNVEHHLPLDMRREYEALLWDLKIQEDAANGKLDKVFDEAKEERIAALEAEAERIKPFFEEAKKKAVENAIRCEKAEAKLSKAVEALKAIDDVPRGSRLDDLENITQMMQIARATLKEIGRQR